MVIMLKRERSPDWAARHQAKHAVTGDQFSASCHEPSSTRDEISVLDNLELETSTGCECHVTGCNQSFASTADYEEHYRSCHSYVCRYCLRFYPTNHLLEIHLLESHDSLFSVLSKKQPMFQCLEESCPEHFMDTKSRQDHVTSCHGYPPYFQFDRRQGTRAVDMTGGREESRDVGVSGRRKGHMTAGHPITTKVPEKVNFGIGGSELFAVTGATHIDTMQRGAPMAVHRIREDPMDDT